MRATIMLLAAAMGLSLIADGNKGKPKHTFAPGEFERRARESYERKSGGIIRKQNSAKGAVLVVNAQDRVNRRDLDAALCHIDETVHPILEYREAKDIKTVNPKADIERLGGKVGVVIADEPDAPALMVAPEEGWAVVNVRALAVDSPTAEVLAARTRKELLRAFALAGGCSFMARGQIVVREGLHTAKDLDTIPIEEYGVDVLMTLGRSLPSYGVMPWIETTYKKACQEGWAPAPTNDIQKAIWDKVHQLPSEPIKIKPEVKKVRD